jgi:long-subunit acyl-CoA synthetase (AMP-forming)
MRDFRDVNGEKIAALDASTLCGAFQATASARPGQVAHRTLDGSIEITYRDFAERVRALATGFHALGARRGDTVGLMLLNRPEFGLADVAAMHAGLTTFSIYNTLSAEQIGYLLRNAGNRIVVTERMFLPRILEARTPELEHIVLVDGEADGTTTLS